MDTSFNIPTEEKKQKVGLHFFIMETSSTSRKETKGFGAFSNIRCFLRYPTLNPWNLSPYITVLPECDGKIIGIDINLYRKNIDISSKNVW